mmetsp:Transcript_11652/g.15213  ORF Transcript_11652/g.15213 Transcript_11652/m.15213 type:complete len:80 (+) Transcript_11652:565-804(+)
MAEEYIFIQISLKNNSYALFVLSVPAEASGILGKMSLKELPRNDGILSMTKHNEIFPMKTTNRSMYLEISQTMVKKISL